MRESLEFRLLASLFAIVAVSTLAAGAVILHVERSHIRALARERLEGTARVVVSGLEHTMLEADESVTEHLIHDLGALGGFTAIEVFDNEGRKAFAPESSTLEPEVLRRIATSERSFSSKSDDAFTFYMPLINKPECYECHDADTRLRGFVKIAMPLESENQKISQFIFAVVVGSLLLVVFTAVLLRSVMRRIVIRPIHALKAHAEKMAHGDLSFRSEIAMKDEIGQLDRSLKQSVSSLSGILRRVREVSGRIAHASDVVQRDSDDVVRGTEVEGQAVADISSSVAQLNAAISEVSGSTETLAFSAEQSAALVDELATSIGLIREISADLTDSVAQADTSIGEMSTETRQIASSGQKLVSMTAETLSAVEGILASIHEVERNAKQSSALSEKVASDASTVGADAVNKTIEGMQRIQATVEKISEAVHKFAKRSEEIGNITDVIDEMTARTSLLALNAAILSAQAGEHGTGFSVVAGEMNTLAERTASSTQQIAGLVHALREQVGTAVEAIDEGLASVREGLKLSHAASDALDMILDSSSRSRGMASSIEKATEEQSKAARSATEAMEGMRAMVAQIAGATSEQNKAVAVIKKTSNRMRDGARQVQVAAAQQAAGSRKISEAVQMVSEKTQEISRAIREQRVEASQICSSVEQIKAIPSENRDIAVRISRMLQELLKDSDLVSAEMRRFTFHDGDP